MSLEGKVGPRVLVVDDEQDILELIELALVRMGLEVSCATGVAAAKRCLDEGQFALCLTDMRMPDGVGLEVVRHIADRNLDVPVAVITAHGNLEDAVAVLKAGAFDYLSKPVSLEQLRALVHSALKLPGSARTVAAEGRLLGESGALMKVREMIAKVARSQAPVHISGESGSGKEVAARMIVEQSARSDQPFIAVNCGAIPENLMESEFFGYRKGAFTGAERDRDGFFQAANHGTLFLDEVADLPMAMQVKLLRAIQEKKIRRVGDAQEDAVDVRILSATHKNLAKCVQDGSFRQDLYYRLNVISIQMPSLREMHEDIPLIAERVLARLRGDRSMRFATEAIKALQDYGFPGNVRELENVVERAVALSADGVIRVDDLHLMPFEGHLSEEGREVAEFYPLTDYLDRVEREAILLALNKTGFNRTAAAKLLGVTFRALRYRMDRLSITDKDKSQ